MRYHGKRQLIRQMQAIDQALRAQRWPTDKALATDLEVGPRTIRRDLEFMRDEHHAPIELDGAITTRIPRFAYLLFR
jgi:predicted DNA-binding transcriptional regulator YafY